mmetsp:Transcript_4968/g.12179  ORF Transcript_4968/g.12179 Transcript_4968/m.12179 type:complete len:205 (+) Transcript_4968:625-1239(+)
MHAQQASKGPTQQDHMPAHSLCTELTGHTAIKSTPSAPDTGSGVWLAATGTCQLLMQHTALTMKPQRRIPQASKGFLCWGFNTAWRASLNNTPHHTAPTCKGGRLQPLLCILLVNRVQYHVVPAKGTPAVEASCPLLLALGCLLGRLLLRPLFHVRVHQQPDLRGVSQQRGDVARPDLERGRHVRVQVGRLLGRLRLGVRARHL